MLHRLTKAIAFFVLAFGCPVLAPLGALLWIFKGGPNVYLEALKWTVTDD